MTKKRLLFILTLLLLITTGGTSVHTVFENKIAESSAEDRADFLMDSTNTECHNCNLLKEKDLIFIDLNRDLDNEKDGKYNIKKVQEFLKAKKIDLYSNNVLFTYIDGNGQSQKLTVREHNEHVLAEEEIPGVPAREGYGDIFNKLIGEKKHGFIDGYNDTTLQMLRESEFISAALPLCSYPKYGPMGVTVGVSVVGISKIDREKIVQRLNLKPKCDGYVCRYKITDLSRKELDTLLKMLCESSTIKNINVFHTGYIVNY